MLLVLAAVLLLVPQHALATPAGHVKALMESGDSAAAYAFGERNPDAMGEPVFDFYFGIAAIDSGHAGEGVLALERYLLHFPGNVSARLQLARGYFALGEDSRAREEFESLRAQHPPADLAATIDRYLDAIRLRETRYHFSAGGYLEAGLGHDSNVNGGVASANLNLPFLGPVVVAPNAQELSSAFTSIEGGGYLSDPIAPGVTLFANGLAHQQVNVHHGQYDLGNFDAMGGVSLLHADNLFRFGLVGDVITVGGSRYRSAFGPTAQWRYQVNQQQSVGLGVLFGRASYDAANRPRNNNFLYANASYHFLFASLAWQPTLTLGVNGGHEATLDAGRGDLSRNLYGARIALGLTPAAAWGVALGFTYQQSDYQAPDIILGVRRLDRYKAFDATVTYLLTRNLSARAEAQVARNDSNIALYSYPRDVVALKLRYAFH